MNEFILSVTPPGTRLMCEGRTPFSDLVKIRHKLKAVLCVKG